MFLLDDYRYIRNENNRNYNFFLFKISWILIMLYGNSWDIIFQYNLFLFLLQFITDDILTLTIGKVETASIFNIIYR